jgi:hypothetical protein
MSQGFTCQGPVMFLADWATEASLATSANLLQGCCLPVPVCTRLSEGTSSASGSLATVGWNYVSHHGTILSILVPLFCTGPYLLWDKALKLRAVWDMRAHKQVRGFPTAVTPNALQLPYKHVAAD